MKLFILISILALMFGCSQPTREEVTSRFDSGEKRVVVVYEGTGSEEVLIERRTYDLRGRLVQLEDLKSGSTKGFLELNPDLQSASGLQEFLSGEWHEQIHRIYNSSENLSRMTYNFAENELSVSRTYTTSYGSGSLNDPPTEQNTETSSFSLEYADNLVLLIDYEEEALQWHEDIPQPASEFTSVEIIDSQTIQIRRYQVFDGDIELPIEAIARLHRSEDSAALEAVAWAAERDQMLDEALVNRRSHIDQHFPEWSARLDIEAAQQRAQSDRDFAEDFDFALFRKYRHEVSEELIELLEDLDMTIAEYREYTDMSDDEFEQIYLFADDGTILPKVAWEFVNTTDPITSDVFVRAQVENVYGAMWIYRDKRGYTAGIRPERGVSYSEDDLTLRVDENSAFAIPISSRNDSGNIFFQLDSAQVEQLRSGDELLIDYDSYTGRHIISFTLTEVDDAIDQLDSWHGLP